MHKSYFHTTGLGIAGITAVGIVALFMTPADYCNPVNLDGLLTGMVMAIAFICAVGVSIRVPVGGSIAIGQKIMSEKAVRENSTRKDEEA